MRLPLLDAGIARWLVVGVAGLRRQGALALAVEGVCDGELTPTCPGCGRELYVSLDRDPAIVHDEDPVTTGGGRTSTVRVGAARAEVLDLVNLLERAGRPELAAKVQALDAEASCPCCAHSFNLIDVGV